MLDMRYATCRDRQGWTVQEIQEMTENGQLSSAAESDLILLRIWLQVASWNFLDVPHCMCCGRAFRPLQDEWPVTGYIAECDCDEQAHLDTFRNPQRERDLRNRIATRSRR